jgi:hypothetical protein
MSEVVADVAFVRVGSCQVIAKVDDVFTVQITLNGSPDSMWMECYRHPTDYTDNESHPSRTVVRGNKIVFFSIESELEKNVMAMDNYLNQANDCYRKKLIQQLALKNHSDFQKKNKQDELDRVNKKISSF